MMSLLLGILCLLVLVSVALSLRGFRLGQQQSAETVRLLDERQRVLMAELQAHMTGHLMTGLMDQNDRLHRSLGELSGDLRTVLSQELHSSRDKMQTLEQSQMAALAESRQAILATVHEVLAGQGKAGQELIQKTLLVVSEQVRGAFDQLSKVTDGRLAEISGRVNERLEVGFQKTNETFANVMARLATIDEAQKKIEGLSTNVLSLQTLLGDKRSRGAFGEVQLEVIVANMLPARTFAVQHQLPSGLRADCMLFLPEPTGNLAIDAKFPLENFHRMSDMALSELDRAQAQRVFSSDVKKHIDAIADKYIVPGETCDWAVMFVPAEAIFAEIHSHHPNVIDHAMKRRILVVSPTTLMAVLTTAAAVLKDVETKKHVSSIRDSLIKLSKEFGRFDERLKKLADHIRMANKDAEEVCVTGRKISNRFAEIERVEGHEPARELEDAGEVTEADVLPLTGEKLRLRG